MSNFNEHNRNTSFQKENIHQGHPPPGDESYLKKENRELKDYKEYNGSRTKNFQS